MPISRNDSHHIVGVSVKFKCGAEIRLPKPNRHHNCFAKARELGLGPIGRGSDNQGFYLDTGEYLNRTQAMEHVITHGSRLIPMSLCEDINNSQYLFSEDLW